MADEQDVALDEMKRKLVQGELDLKHVLIEMAKLINREISGELAMALTHTTYIQKLKSTNCVMTAYIRILLHSDLLWKNN